MKIEIGRQTGIKPAIASKERAEERSEQAGIWAIRILVTLGLFALIYYFSWWQVGGRITSPWLALALMVAAVYNLAQLVGNWVLYLGAKRRTGPPRLRKAPTVDVFVTAYKEEHSLIERALAAACAMRGEHRTWLLDDGEDAALEVMARRLGAGYLTRTDRKDAKAGNVNAALARTDGEIVVIFDIDHAPVPEFLERTLGYFADPKVGFVQVMLTFCNRDESWVARAAGESTLDYYNPTSMGMDGIGSATLVGSNALIRRSALELIGGYRPGLAEDLATSIRLHAAGWKSVYVAEPLAPGLAPATMLAWFTQQLKWARGVFEVLIKAYPRLFRKLTWGQRLSYMVRSTFYWVGPVAALHLFFTVAVLVGGNRVVHIAWENYLLHAIPLAISVLLVRQAAFLTWRHRAAEASLLWRAMVLMYATWPIYLLAWIMAMLRVPLAFRPTPKSHDGTLNPLWLMPQVLSPLVLTGGILYLFLSQRENSGLILIAIAALQGVLPIIFLLNSRTAGDKKAKVLPQVLAEPIGVISDDMI